MEKQRLIVCHNPVTFEERVNALLDTGEWLWLPCPRSHATARTRARWNGAARQRSIRQCLLSRGLLVPTRNWKPERVNAPTERNKSVSTWVFPDFATSGKTQVGRLN